MASSDSQIDKPQRGRPKRAELPDVNINTGAQSVNSGSFFKGATGKNGFFLTTIMCSLQRVQGFINNYKIR